MFPTRVKAEALPVGKTSPKCVGYSSCETQVFCKSDPSSGIVSPK